MNKYQEAYDFILNATKGGEGMVKELNIIRELVDKAAPKKPRNQDTLEHSEITFGDCPNCGVLDLSNNFNYCPVCGQCLDWSKES